MWAPLTATIYLMTLFMKHPAKTINSRHLCLIYPCISIFLLYFTHRQGLIYVMRSWGDLRRGRYWRPPPPSAWTGYSIDMKNGRQTATIFISSDVYVFTFVWKMTLFKLMCPTGEFPGKHKFRPSVEHLRDERHYK